MVTNEKIAEFSDDCNDRMKSTVETLQDEALDTSVQKHFGSYDIKEVLMSFFCFCFCCVTKEASTDQFTVSINMCACLRRVLLNFRKRELLCWWDECIRGALKIWAQWVKMTVIPRPSKFGLLDPPEDMIQFYSLFLKSQSIMCSIPQTDIIIFAAFMTYQKAAIDQIVDHAVHSIDLHLKQISIISDKEKIASSVLRSITIASLRMIRMFSYCKSTWKRVYSKNVLRAVSLEQIQKFEEYLIGDEKFLLRESTADKKVYISSSLLSNEAKIEFFHNTCCEIGLGFEDEFVVTIKRESDAEYRIIVDGRNMCRKCFWVGKISQDFNFLPIDDFSYLDPFFAKWIQEISFSLHMMLFCMLRYIEFVESEVVDALSINSVYRMYYLVIYCGLSLHEFFPVPSDSSLSPLLWRICSLICAKWIKSIAKNLKSLKPSERPSIISLLNCVNKLLYQCPQEEWIHRLTLYDSLLLLKKAIRAETCYEEHATFFLERTMLLYFRNFMDESECSQSSTLDGKGLMSPKLIGKGSFGSVFRCFDLEKNRTVAVKETPIKEKSKFDKNRELSTKEANYLKFLKHPLTVEIYNVVATKNHIFITMEHCDGGNLLTKIQKEGPLDDYSFRYYAVGFIKALCLLHCNNIAHGDLKPSNIMVEQHGFFRLGDFGAAEQLVRKHSRNSSGLGTIQYAAPEVLTTGKWSLSSDIWSLGCVFFFMKTGLAPWYQYKDMTTIIYKLGNGTMFDLSPLEKVHPEIVKIIKSCLQFDPSRRPLANSILLNNFLFEVDG